MKYDNHRVIQAESVENKKSSSSQTKDKVTKVAQACITRLKVYQSLLRGIAYNFSNKGNYSNTNEIGTTESTENCETEKKNTEVENDKKVSFDNVTNVG